MGVRGYLPPDGPQNIHGVPHQYNEEQGAHRTRESVIYSPEAIILTGVETVQDDLERLGLEEVPQEVAEECLDIYQSDEEDPDRTVQDVIDDYQTNKTPVIPEDEVLREMDYHQGLLPLATETGAKARADGQTREELVSILRSIRDENLETPDETVRVSGGATPEEPDQSPDQDQDQDQDQDHDLEEDTAA